MSGGLYPYAGEVTFYLQGALFFTLQGFLKFFSSHEEPVLDSQASWLVKYLCGKI
jgi:hypothetical protein